MVRPLALQWNEDSAGNFFSREDLSIIAEERFSCLHCKNLHGGALTRRIPWPQLRHISNAQQEFSFGSRR